jgi:hypothetical protein
MSKLKIVCEVNKIKLYLNNQPVLGTFTMMDIPDANFCYEEIIDCNILEQQRIRL